MARRRTKKTLKERVDKYLTEWADFLGLSQTWEIDVTFVDEIDGETAGGYTPGATIDVHFPYQRASICVAKVMEEDSDYSIERSMLHELLHIPLARLLASLKLTTSVDVYDIAWNQTETVADLFTRVLLRQKYEVKH